MAIKRKICVVTGTRAEYGLLYGLIREIHEDPDLQLQLVVTGTHLSPEFGYTVNEILADGFPITEKVEMLLSSDSPVGIGKSIGLGIIGFVEAFHRLSPDIVVLLGDRYEAMAAAQAAMVNRIPIAHLHGGERTEGLMDEAIRHAITKMSHLHFVSTEAYRKRVIQLGEQPDKVYPFGAIGIDNIMNLPLMDREELEQSIPFKFGDVNFLVTYHPVTLDSSGPERAVGELLAALSEFPDARIIFTMPNADPNNRKIIDMIRNFVRENGDRAIAVASLGKIRYLSAIKYCDLVVGNSSSGIIEVPVFKKPTINLGDRQKGREMGQTILNVPENRGDIVKAIQMALSDEFRKIVSEAESIYGYGNVAPRIKEVLKTVRLDGILYKPFYDLEWEH
jgi:UDP-N-acetylglucosamine 2-epimerase (non-hydrolysing)/GDP/UDP-N,N'-diacetylbacillosamine 2-epimerase (hydrolysing)